MAMVFLLLLRAEDDAAPASLISPESRDEFSRYEVWAAVWRF